MKTGNLTIRTHSVVHSIIYDKDKKKAVGVRVVDANTKEMSEYYARIIFVNAACLNSNMILLNSKSERFPNGLGNDSGVLGHYIGFHNYRGRMSGTIDGFNDKYFYGRRPTGPLIPPFRNVFKQESDADFQGRYHISIGASRSGWTRGMRSDKIGSDLKQELQEPGGWRVGGRMSGEVIPRYENHIRLSETETDEWGFPQLIFSIDYGENDVKMMEDYLEKGLEIMEAVGVKNITTRDNNQNPGLDIHEMGGVRMGKDPKTSILNKWNQVHSCENVFVTDGACMTTVSTQNPSLTFMAITARAANYAVEEMSKGNL
jgi:choline dehydrogenase-like flavoprotein